MSEFPLAIFTVFSQVAIGGFITMMIFDQRGRLGSNTSSSASVAVFLFALIATVFSLIHLGDPFGGCRAITNLEDSWLSREILFFTGFFIMSGLYILPVEGLKKIAAPLGFLCGMLALISSACIYMLPSYPAWDTPLTLAQFVLTAAMAGPMLIMAIMYWGGAKISDNAYYCLGVLLFLQLVVSVSFVSFMGSFMEINMMLLAARLILGVVAPAGLMILRQRDDEKYMPTIFTLILLGEVFGRIMFYENALPIMTL